MRQNRIKGEVRRQFTMMRKIKRLLFIAKNGAVEEMQRKP
jgi:hypothetical protein